MDAADIKHTARGRWRNIHTALGIPARLLNGRHQPCPQCGGKDRFRYTDYQGNGGYYCNQCGSGSGLDLLMLVHGWDFSAALRETARALGISRSRAAARTIPPPPPPARDKIQSLQYQWQHAQPLSGSPAADYLQRRGLSVVNSSQIRFAYADYWTQATDGAPLPVLRKQPAMLAAITDTQGQLQGLHYTYLQHTGGSWHKLTLAHPQTGESLPAKKMQARYSGSLNGAAVHLMPPDAQGRLLIAEGIETALAAAELFRLPAAAALSAHGMQCLHVPPAARELYICADHDHSRTGIKAAEALARRAIRQGIKAHIWQPETAGFDALDELNHRKNSKSRYRI